MKFKLFFGLMLLFASFSATAQSFVGPNQALQIIESTQTQLANGTIAAQTQVGEETSANGHKSANVMYSKLLDIVAENISNQKDTALGIQSAQTSLSTTDVKRAAILSDMILEVQSLLAN